MSITVTINGKPATEANIRDEVERSVFDAAIEGIKDRIASAITPEEQGQIKMHVNGTNLENLDFSLEGPEEIVNKTRAAFE